MITERLNTEQLKILKRLKQQSDGDMTGRSQSIKAMLAIEKAQRKSIDEEVSRISEKNKADSQLTDMTTLATGLPHKGSLPSVQQSGCTITSENGRYTTSTDDRSTTSADIKRSTTSSNLALAPQTTTKVGEDHKEAKSEGIEIGLTHHPPNRRTSFNMSNLSIDLPDTTLNTVVARCTAPVELSVITSTTSPLTATSSINYGGSEVQQVTGYSATDLLIDDKLMASTTTYTINTPEPRESQNLEKIIPTDEKSQVKKIFKMQEDSKMKESHQVEKSACTKESVHFMLNESYTSIDEDPSPHDLLQSASSSNDNLVRAAPFSNDT